MKDKKGFTLIEIIAVIVILGIIMLIAVPSVTNQILLSKKNAYATNVKSFLESADSSYREKHYGDYLEDREIIVAPLDSLKMDVDDLQKSPFGAYDKNRSYIVIKPTTNNFKSYAIVRDAASYGIVGVSYEDISKDSIKNTAASTIQNFNNFYACVDGEVTLNNRQTFVFMGKEYYASDYTLPNSNKCDANNTPVIKFSAAELENGDVYTINYDNNTGEGEMESTVCSFGFDCTLRQLGFTKLGYHFTKWTKVKSGRGVSYSDRQVVKNITFLDHVTLFAQWHINANTLIVDANTGTGSIIQKKNFQDTYEIDVKKTGYTMIRWTPAGECGSYANAAKTTYTFPPGYETTCTLTANWQINQNTLVIDADGGNGGGTYTQNYNTTKDISVSRTGYTFTGWEKSGACGAYENTASMTYTFPPDKDTTCTLKAKWVIHTNTLVVDANKGKGGATYTQDYNTTAAIKVSRSGYNFKGWDASGTCGSYTKKASTTYTFPADDGTTCTLKAKWKKKPSSSGGGGGCSGGTGCWCGCCDSCAAAHCHSHGGTWDGGCH